MSENKRKVIDKEQIYKLASIQCTNEEIALIVGCSVNHLAKKYKNIIAQGKESGKRSLRRAMWEKALNGDTRAQIFLSKQTLGFKDNPEDGNIKTPLPWKDED